MTRSLMSGEIIDAPAPEPIDKWEIFDRIGYHPTHREVVRFHNSTARTKVCSAPRRSTKSYAAAKDVLAGILTENTRTWIVGPNYGLAEKEFRYIHADLVINRKKLGLPKPLQVFSNPRSALFIRFPWGSIVEGKSADNPESLLGEAVDQVIYSEAAQLPRIIRERYVQPTVITKKGIEIVPTTPDQGGEWVHELIERSAQEDGCSIDSFHWGVDANPTYDMQEFERAKKFYGAESPTFREQYLGEWVFYGGRVYPVFDERVHVIEPFDIPVDWPVLRGIDFGHRDPFVTLGCAVGPSSELYFFQEYYDRAGKGIRDHAVAIKAAYAGRRVTTSVGDPAAAQSIDDLCFEGVSVTPGHNDRTAGRMRVLEYMQPTEDGVAPWPLRDLPIALKAKWPRLYVFSTMKETLREMRYFRWKEAGKGEGDKERTEGEDHAMDAMRYIVMTRPSPYRMMPRVPRNSFKGWLSRVATDRTIQSYIGRH